MHVIWKTPKSFYQVRALVLDSVIKSDGCGCVGDGGAFIKKNVYLLVQMELWDLHSEIIPTCH